MLQSFFILLHFMMMVNALLPPLTWKIMPNVSDEHGMFGHSIAVAKHRPYPAIPHQYQRTVIIGAPGAEKVYIYKENLDDRLPFQLTQVLWPNFAFALLGSWTSSDFGWSVAATDNGYLAVGAPSHGGCSSVGPVTYSQPEDYDDEQCDDRGGVYVYYRKTHNSPYEYLHYVQPHHGHQGYRFGHSVSWTPSAIYLAVGAPFDNICAVNDAGISGQEYGEIEDRSCLSYGAVYVFSVTPLVVASNPSVLVTHDRTLKPLKGCTGTWNAVEKQWMNLECSAHDQFYLGQAVLFGTEKLLMAGAPGDSVCDEQAYAEYEDCEGSGSVQIHFDQAPTIFWTTTRLKPEKVKRGQFGASLAYNSDLRLLAIGAPLQPRDLLCAGPADCIPYGIVEVWELLGLDEWVRQHVVFAPNGVQGSPHYGAAVAFSGTDLVATMPLDSRCVLDGHLPSQCVLGGSASLELGGDSSGFTNGGTMFAIDYVRNGEQFGTTMYADIDYMMFGAIGAAACPGTVAESLCACEGTTDVPFSETEGQCRGVGAVYLYHSKQNGVGMSTVATTKGGDGGGGTTTKSFFWPSTSAESEQGGTTSVAWIEDNLTNLVLGGVGVFVLCLLVLAFCMVYRRFDPNADRMERRRRASSVSSVLWPDELTRRSRVGTDTRRSRVPTATIEMQRRRTGSRVHGRSGTFSRDIRPQHY